METANSKSGISLNNKQKKTISFFFVILSQVMVFAAGILSSVLLPKLFSVTDYGYIKTFTLYFSYLGLAHFGFVDGLHILLSNKTYDQFDKNYIRKLTTIYTIFELVLSVIGAVIALIVLKDANRIVFIALAIAMFAYNLYGYSQQLAVASSRFNLVTICNSIDAVFKLLSILLIWILSSKMSVHFVYYIAFYIIQYLVMAIVLIVSMKECFFGKISSKEVDGREIFRIVKTGVPLLIANLLASFVSSTIAFFIQIAYPVEFFDTYSIYSFAISMSTIISPIVTAVSVILFPTIRKMKESDATSLYNKMFRVLSVLISFVLFAFPIILLVFSKLVPNYSSAFSIFGILFPGILTTSIVICVNLNYFKLMNKIWQFNLISIATSIITVIAALACYFTFLKQASMETTLTTYAIIGLLSRIVWFISTSVYVQKLLSKNIFKEICYLFISFGMFYGLCHTGILTTIGFVFFYLLGFIAFTLAFFLEDCILVFNRVKKISIKLFRRFQK